MLKIITYTLLWLAASYATAQNCHYENIVVSTPTFRFSINEDGTISDGRTGLMWKQCNEGLTGTNCSEGTLVSVGWNLALQQAQTANSGGGFANYDDWRLPNIKELASIMESMCRNPALNLAIFPGNAGRSVWSSSPGAMSDRAWIGHFDAGIVYWSLRTDSHGVHLVRNEH